MADSESQSFAPRQILSDVLDFLFPPKCQVCGRNFSGDNIWLCPNCSSRLEIASFPVCVICRQPLVRSMDSCPHCHRRGTIDWLYSLGGYAGAYSELVKSFKYGPKPGIAGLLGGLLADQLAEFEHIDSIDLLCPVPLHHKKHADRGFNQAALLADEIGARLSIDSESYLLIQTRRTKDQIGLDLEERFANVQGVFAVRAGVDLAGCRILLIDDVTTSGATLNEAARAIKSAGAASVAACTVAMSYEEGIDFLAACHYLTAWPE
jgi:competence protein ComFC